MAAAAIEKTAPALNGESKSARKKKAKAEAVAAGNATPDTPSVMDKDDSVDGRADADGGSDHPYVKELQKQIRNINKKLAAMQKTDAVIEANPGVTLDDLVAQRKINTDQKASALKKPGLQSQRTQLEEQIQTYRQVDADHRAQLQKQKEELVGQHRKELEDVTEKLKATGLATGAGELRKQLLVFTQFLRTAAYKRSSEEDANSPENTAFEGALLKVYGGDAAAVQTAVNIIEGSDEQVPGIDDNLTTVKYSQIKKASQDHAPQTAEEEWVDQVAQATAGGHDETLTVPAGSDPTIAHAGLTELDASGQANGMTTAATHESSGAGFHGSTGDEGGNVAGERWDTSGGPEKRGMEDSYEMIPRPNDEVDTPTAASQAPAEVQEKTSWADESMSLDPTATGNKAGESWAARVPGEQQQDNVNAAPGWGDEPAEPADDGYQQVSSKRGGRGRGRGEGEFRGGRGRGGPRGGFRGDGERGRGGRGGGGGRGGFRGDGERGRGRGGRGRGDGPPRS